MGQTFITRRKFVKTATAAVTATALIDKAVAQSTEPAVLRHASIGVGGMGWHDLNQFKQHPGVKIVALCDVDVNNLKKAAEAFPEARVYADWRELLAKEKNNIDSVNITVPDHNHYIIAINAIRGGKHVYCQKPMCHDVAEVRSLTKEAVKRGVVTQLGTQIASGKGDRTAVHWVKQKAIGNITHAYLCSNRKGAVENYRLEGPRPEEDSPVPGSLNWDLWLGAAPFRPYAPRIYHPVLWRSWQDFGTGWSGDIGCHIFDAVWKGMNLKAPLSVMAEVQDSWENSETRRKDTWPQGDHITWIFRGNEFTEGDTFMLEWFDGSYYPPEEVRALYKGDYPEESAMLIGTEGALLIPHGGMPVLLPEEKFAGYTQPEMEDRNHYHHFADACLKKAQNESGFAQTGPMTEAILLGTIAIRTPGTLLKWDAEKMRFPNHPAADRFLKRTYRKGWEVKRF
ncbi:MAG: Gfo/Idh/MocA family oxidoreductase [Chitinophagaceae bacterium]|nr:Gfo/Idh/MocA family oxidoreductase [Chitinophagaceae bacterium]MCW5928938.1 Gfo/Idh/MocA family oxidoreductase [Chitinophagaceae bacterium]